MIAGGGAILLWSALEGKSWSTVLRDIISGQNPATAPNTNAITAGAATLDDTTSGSGAITGGSTAANSAGYARPIGSGLTPERIDQGCDYGGSGPLYALGSGTIVSVYNSGWPGGIFICLKMTNGLAVYYAEDITPAVTVGQTVKAGQQIGTANGGPDGIEVGWASPSSIGEAMAGATGQSSAGESASGDPGEFSTGYGVAFNTLMVSLGVPSCHVNQPVQGSAPAEYS